MNELLKLLADNPAVRSLIRGEAAWGQSFGERGSIVAGCRLQAKAADHDRRENNTYTAQRLQERLEPLLHEQALLFVMEESLRVQAIASSPEDKDEMIYSLTQLVKDNKPKIIICNVAAFTRYLPDPVFF